MNESQKRTSSITTKGVVPIPAKPHSSGLNESPRNNEMKPASAVSKTNPNVRVGSSSTAKRSVTSTANSGIKVSSGRTDSGGVVSNGSSSNTKPTKVETSSNQNAERQSRVQRTSQLAASADTRDKHGRTPKQKRREDFVVNSLTTLILLGVVFGGLYYAYTVAMGILN